MKRGHLTNDASSTRYKDLDAGDWSVLEQLFGENGACGGCWCQYWRVNQGGKLWYDLQGAKAKEQMKNLLENGRVHGILAMIDGVAVGWCSYGLRTEFPRLERVKAYRREDIDGVWSINCFFVLRPYRGKGIMRGLIGSAIEAIKNKGGKMIESYPAALPPNKKKLAAAFAWTGVESIFLEFGFEEVQRYSKSKPLFRLSL